MNKPNLVFISMPQHQWDKFKYFCTRIHSIHMLNDLYLLATSLSSCTNTIHNLLTLQNVADHIHKVDAERSK